MKKAVLIIMDGFGIAPATPGNAITTANTPNLDALLGHIQHSEDVLQVAVYAAG